MASLADQKRQVPETLAGQFLGTDRRKGTRTHGWRLTSRDGMREVSLRTWPTALHKAAKLTDAATRTTRGRSNATQSARA